MAKLMGFRLGLAAALLMGGVGVAYSRQAAQVSCEMGDAEPVNLAELTPEFDLRLTDGRALKLAGLVPPIGNSSAELAEMREKLAANLDGRALFAQVLAQVPDRWGRFPAQVFVEGDDDVPMSLTAKLLAAGLARLRPEPEIAPCRVALLAAEISAREAGAGLWADGSLTIYPADAPETLEGMGGKFVIIEGKVQRIFTGRSRTFLDFGTRRGIDVTATISKKVLKIFEQSGVTPENLRGRNIRLRGTLDTRFGPRIELFSPDAVEVVE